MAGDAELSLVSRTSIVGGVVGGLVHAGVAVFLWSYFGFDSLWDMLLIKPLNGGYIVLGMFLLGFVPVLFYLGAQVKSPAIIVAGFLLLSGIGSLLAGPVGAPSAVPTPFALYILFWIVVVALAGVTGRVESSRNQPSTG